MTQSRTPARVRWKAAALLGLISSTFSTLISQLTAARIGRDAAVDWMVVAVIPLRDWALQIEPSWAVIAAGILFHQGADFFWEVVFFGALGRWTADLRPGTIIILAVPWAVFTSALEYFFLVPALPFWQPIFTLEQPYWIGLLVHLSSASMYPLFPWLRDWVAGRNPSPHRRFTAVWSGAALAGMVGLGIIALFGWQGREIPHSGGNVAYDQAYLRRMAAHHAQGVDLAVLAAERAQDQHLRALARLMAAAQKGEIATMDQWWRSWFGGALPPASPEDHAGMPGMVAAGQIEELRGTGGAAFDPLFVRLMTHHHKGAIAMADEAWREAGDIRIRLLSHAIRHEQRGEIELMHGIRPGFETVRSAWRSLLAPAGAADAELPSVDRTKRGTALILS
jgi:uncharacterized protein (DUF305 family)